MGAKAKKMATAKHVNKKNKFDRKTSGKKAQSNGIKKRPHKKQHGRESPEHVDDVPSKMYKPSKASKHELKAIIAALKKDPTLILTRRALRYIPSFLKSTGLTKKLLKEVIRLWADSHEKIRVICLLCIIRIFRKQEESIKSVITKRMYTSYMKAHINHKTDEKTFPLVVFMRQSLIEIYSLDKQLAYNQAFVFCKQLASTLKNAYENKLDKSYKTVYNWQFVNCLILWSNLVASLMPSKHIEQLLNPVIQLHMGTINLISSPRYYPLYLHLIENLVNLAAKLDVFIPVLPLLTTILDRLKLNQSSKKEEKSFNFDTLIYVSTQEAQNKNYIDTTANRIYELLVKYFASQSHKIAFPELCLLPKLQIKKFIKENKKECEKYRDMMTRLEENIKFIEDRRQSVEFSFTNLAAIDAWEKATKDTGKLAIVKLASKIQAEQAASNSASDALKVDNLEDEDGDDDGEADGDTSDEDETPNVGQDVDSDEDENCSDVDNFFGDSQIGDNDEDIGDDEDDDDDGDYDDDDIDDDDFDDDEGSFSEDEDE